MNCEELNACLDLLMDGQLTDDQRREMQAHGQKCPQCAEAIRRTVQLKALLEQMEPEVDVPLPARAKWRSAVRQEARQGRRKKLIRWIGSAAAAVVVLAGVGLMLNQRVEPKGAVEKAQTVMLSAAEESVEDAAVTASDSAEAGGADMAFEADNSARQLLRAATSNDIPAESAVIEADGAVDEAEEDFAEFEEAADRGMCAAVAQKTSACEATIRVKDVDAACRQIVDLAQEYEGKADVRSLENGGTNVYLTLDAANAADFLEAIAPLDVDGQPLKLPVREGDQILQILLTIVGE